jgi:CRP-like cAMP-binding protein
MTTEQLPESLDSLFRQKFQLDNDQLALISDKFRPTKIEKKGFYLKQGDIAKSKAFLVKGAVRYFYLDNNLKENTLFFRFENMWLGDIESYHEQTPSKISIQTLEDSELLIINKTDFAILQQQIPALEKWYAINAVKMYASLFNKLVEAKPQIFQRVSLQHIAAYLEIEPQSLSRLRKRLLKSDK